MAGFHTYEVGGALELINLGLKNDVSFQNFCKVI
jgi:hypothetical protein